jgi:hypothetical protein
MIYNVFFLVNNMLHSAFRSVSLVINDTPLTQNPGNYPYKYETIY